MDLSEKCRSLKQSKSSLLSSYKKISKLITFSQLKDYIKNKSVFKGRAKLTSYIKDKLLMRLLELKLCTLVNDKIVINPRLK